MGGVAAAERSSTANVDLVRRAQGGDPEAFASLVSIHVDRLHRVALGILREDADARDAVQDAFLRAWRELPRLRDANAFDAWLGRINVNACRTLYRRRRQGVRQITVPYEVDGSADVADARIGLAERQADLDLVERAFDHLRAEDRALLVLHHGERLDLADIAARLGIESKTVKSRLFTARRALERALEEERR